MDFKSRAEINRQNAQKSTGPRTEAGKDISKYNALKHGLNSRRILNDDSPREKEAFDDFEASYEAEYHPRTLEEISIVKSIVEIRWQIMRSCRLLELAYLGPDDVHKTAKTLDTYSRHECRLQKNHDTLVVRIKSLVAQREAETTRRLTEADAKAKAQADATSLPVEQHKPSGLGPIGFVLQSLAEVPQPATDEPQNHLENHPNQKGLKPAA